MLTLALVCASHANSTILVKYNFEQLCKHAKLIITGKVTSIDYVWNNEVKLIFTHVTIKPDVIVKDLRAVKTKESIIVTHIGGILDSSYCKFEGTPDFKTGESVFLFLRSDDLLPEAYNVIGWHQGKHQITEDYVRGPEKSLNEYIEEVKSIINNNP